LDFTLQKCEDVALKIAFPAQKVSWKKDFSQRTLKSNKDGQRLK